MYLALSHLSHWYVVVLGRMGVGTMVVGGFGHTGPTYSGSDLARL